MAGNHNSGRRPQPTALKVLRGNPSKTRLNEDEPTPPAGEVVKPAGLSPGASRVWDEQYPIVSAMRVMTVADVLALETLCEMVESFNVIRSRKGTEAFNVRDEIAVAAQMRPYIEMFGLNPSSRSKLHVAKEEAPASKWAGVLK
jgi:phage terminase small subunit